MNVIPLLQSVGRIGNWIQLPFFGNGQFLAVCGRLAGETCPVLPAPDRILRPFELTQPENVRVVIVGQDPYPDWNPQLATGLATGLAFAVPPGTAPLPSSLDKIFKKLPSAPQTHPNLEHWARSGVLLLNTTLTIPVDMNSNPPKGVGNAHMRFGWSFLIRQVVESLVHKKDVFFMFLGVLPRDMDIIPPNLPPDRMIRVSHPADRGRPPTPPWIPFRLSFPFTRADNFFQQLSPPQQPIAW